MNGATLKELEDSNSIICELPGQNNYVDIVTNVEDTEDAAPKIPQLKENRRWNNWKVACHKKTFLHYHTCCVLF